MRAVLPVSQCRWKPTPPAAPALAADTADGADGADGGKDPAVEQVSAVPDAARPILGRYTVPV